MSNHNFNNILFAVKEEAIQQHGDLICSTLRQLIPDAHLQFISQLPATIDLQPVDLLITAQFPWLPALLEQCPHLRWVHLLTSGTEVLDTCASAYPNLLMSRSAGVNASAIAEYVLGAICYHAKNFASYEQQKARQQWQRYWSQDLTGKNMLILGTGPVGQAIARSASAIGMLCTGISRSGKHVPEFKEVLAMQSMQALLPQADYLVIALPLTDATRNAIDATVLAQLAPHCFLVDVSRGGILDTHALLQALTAQKLAGAALDVFETEPLPPDSHLWNTPNLLLTPHIAGTSDHFMQNALSIFTANYQSLQSCGRLATPIAHTEKAPPPSRKTTKDSPYK